MLYIFLTFSDGSLLPPCLSSQLLWCVDRIRQVDQYAAVGPSSASLLVVSPRFPSVHDLFDFQVDEIDAPRILVVVALNHLGIVGELLLLFLASVEVLQIVLCNIR